MGVLQDLPQMSGHLFCKVLFVLSHLFGSGWLRLWETELLYHRNVGWKGPLVIIQCDVPLKSISGSMFCPAVFRAMPFPSDFLCLHISYTLPPRVTHGWGNPACLSMPVSKCILEHCLSQRPPTNVRKQNETGPFWLSSTISFCKGQQKPALTLHSGHLQGAMIAMCSSISSAQGFSAPPQLVIQRGSHFTPQILYTYKFCIFWDGFPLSILSLLISLGPFLP